MNVTKSKLFMALVVFSGSAVMADQDTYQCVLLRKTFNYPTGRVVHHNTLCFCKGSKVEFDGVPALAGQELSVGSCAPEVTDGVTRLLVGSVVNNKSAQLMILVASALNGNARIDKIVDLEVTGDKPQLVATRLKELVKQAITTEKTVSIKDECTYGAHETGTHTTASFTLKVTQKNS